MTTLALEPIRYDHLVHDDRIHASLYTDPRIFAEEMEKIFYRGWVFVGHDSKIPQPGDYITRHIGTQPVIMVREKMAEFLSYSIAAPTAGRLSARRRKAMRACLPVRIMAGRMT